MPLFHRIVQALKGPKGPPPPVWDWEHPFGITETFTESFSGIIDSASVVNAVGLGPSVTESLTDMFSTTDAVSAVIDTGLVSSVTQTFTESVSVTDSATAVVT